MSLATRCTSCGTVFRVVQDQLKVSEGWVRCGRCDAVFNAFEGLFDLGRDSPPDWNGAPTSALSAETAPEGEPTDIGVDVYFDPPPLPPPARTPTPAPAPTSTGECSHRHHPAFVEPSTGAVADKGHPSSSFPSTAPAAFEDLLADPIDAHLFRKRGPVSDAKVDERDRLEFSDARFDSDLFAENSSADEDGSTESPASGAADLPLESAHQQPDFLRRAERKARWQQRPDPGRARPRQRDCRGGAAAAGRHIISATPPPPAGPPPGRSSSPGASSPTAASRRRAGSTRCWSTAPRSPGRSASTPSFFR